MLLDSTAPTGRLHVVTDTRLQTRHPHAELARLAALGGADTVQFRHKHGPMRARWGALTETAEACHAAGVALIVDDHADLALAIGAGVHIGQADLPVDVVRRLLGPAVTVGATASTVSEALDAEAAGASYIGFGPVFGTASKENPAPAPGLDGLAAACAAVRIPVVAIGGMTPARVADVLGAGAWGIAVLSAVVCAPDVTAAAAAFRDAIDAAR
ncbi:MAG TPA: thiamine phosphate synthase [Rubricoccaceae bacterium]|jgi:thiamine-phosphate pyrophosphorylase